jgi:hypothetical protein
MIITSSIGSTSINDCWLRTLKDLLFPHITPLALLHSRSRGRRWLRPRDLANGGRELDMVHAVDYGWWRRWRARGRNRSAAWKRESGKESKEMSLPPYVWNAYKTRSVRLLASRALYMFSSGREVPRHM